MNQKTKMNLRIISVVIALVVVFMYFGILPFIDVVDEFWTMSARDTQVATASKALFLLALVRRRRYDRYTIHWA